MELSTSLSKHQFESGQALGLTNVQLYTTSSPTGLEKLLPQAINLVTRMIKTTSLVVLIGVVEVTKGLDSKIIDSNRLTIPTASFWIYGTILVLYFAVCFPISKLSTHLEKHWRN